jgi:23S rRNA pseudouridine1911/1915/1917 synthase
MEQQLICTQEGSGVRIDKYICDRCPELTRSSVQRLMEQGDILRNGAPCNKKDKLVEGDVIFIRQPDPKPLDVEAQDIPLDIVYEDDHLLVVNKPQGMVVHPAAGNPDGTLVNALLHHCKGRLSGINGVIRPGIVHRIDKDTSGLLIVAKDDAAHVGLSEQIKEHSFKREYEAILIGRLKQTEGTVDAPIGRHKVDRKKMCITPHNSKHAVTHYQVIQYLEDHHGGGGYTHVRCRLETGRTHQIRVHMASLGHPVAGDPVYGPKKDRTGQKGQLLHARTIGFIHPVTGEYLEFTSPLPPHFVEFLKKHGAAPKEEET